MTDDAKYTLGGRLMWGGVVVLAAATAAARWWPVAATAGGLIALPIVVAGAWIKRTYCPRCRHAARTAAAGSDTDES